MNKFFSRVFRTFIYLDTAFATSWSNDPIKKWCVQQYDYSNKQIKDIEMLEGNVIKREEYNIPRFGINSTSDEHTQIPLRYH